MTAVGRVGVIGAGTMGAGIAAHAASAGLDVVLLDIVPDAARQAVERLCKARPAAFMQQSDARRITPGAVADLGLLAGCDWVIEAVVEDAAAKNDVYDEVRASAPGAVITSNTSTIPLAELRCDGITHFFNPPRYLRLLEVVGDEAVLDSAIACADERLGKTVVRCNDAPGFIANRLGAMWIDVAIAEVIARGLDVELADAAVARAFGSPRTGVFGLLDLVGIDLSLDVTRSLAERLPANDPLHAVDRPTALLEGLVASGRTGRKGGGGFYRLAPDRSKLALDLAADEYRPARRYRGDEPAGTAFAAVVRERTLAYAERIMDEVSGDPGAVDEAMEAGYAWRSGPFAMLGRPAPRRRRPGVLRLADLKAEREPLRGNPSASLWDIGAGVVCLEFHTKMNALDSAIVQLLAETIALAPTALVLHNDGEQFSVGANLAGVLMLANTASWDELDGAIRAGQATFAALRSAPFPVVGAPSGMALGGGCELLLHCDGVQAHAESYIGLPEVGVGIVPGWGGCLRLLQRLAGRAPYGPQAPVQAAFEIIGLGRVSGSAAEARELGFLGPDDRITMNRDRLLADARSFALELAGGYTPPEPQELRLPGPSGRAALELGVAGHALAGRALAHDRVVLGALANVLAGGDADPAVPVTEQHVYDLERAAVLTLLHREPTLQRAEQMLTTGKPLRN
jgi:3-hydroxyacyl-CoA dehydrogenase